MLRKFALSLFLICLAGWCASTVGCGGSSSTPPPTCTGSYDVVGDWEGSFTGSAGTTSANGLINSSGDAAFFDSEADIAVLPSITGNCSFSGTETLYSSLESPSGTGTLTGTAQGNVTSNTAINGTESVNGSSGSFTIASYNPLGTGSVSAVSGTVLADVEGQIQDSLILTLGGTSSSITFSGTDANSCTFNGTFTEEGTSNVYDVAFDVAGTGCTASDLTGIGFESDSDLLDVNNQGTGTYLYAIITSSSAPFVVEVLPESGGRAYARRSHQQGTSFRNVFGFDQRLSR